MWYSTPSILRLLAEFGRMTPRRLRRPATSSSSPARSSRSSTCAPSRELWPTPATSTCTGPPRRMSAPATRCPAPSPEDRTAPFPIGRDLLRRPGQGRGRGGPRRRAGRRGRAAASRAVGHERATGTCRSATRRAFLRRRRRRRAGIAPATSSWRTRAAMLRLPRPPRPHGQATRLPGRAGRDRGGALPPPGRRGGRRAWRSRTRTRASHIRAFVAWTGEAGPR